MYTEMFFGQNLPYSNVDLEMCDITDFTSTLIAVQKKKGKKKAKLH